MQLAGLKASDLGLASHAINTSRVNDIKTVNLSGMQGTYDWLAVSARLAQTNDFAKLQNLFVQPVTSPVPEANTSALLLAGLGLTGLMVRRRV